MIHFAVWVVLPGGSPARVGELACSDADKAGRFESEFAYASDWLTRLARFPLDPVSLPLRAGSFRATKLGPPLGVFEDALPDDWGRRLIIRAHQLPRGQQNEPNLLLRLAEHGLGMGALRFTRPDGPAPAPQSVPVANLAALFAAAERFESGDQSDPEGLRLLFAAGSSPGGARPKVLVSDASGDWIAKFPSRQRDGRFDVVGLEMTGLDLAAQAGLAVPEHRRVRLGKTRRHALLVRRFDVLPGGGRQHMVSLHTLCREGPGRYVLSYSEVAQAIRYVAAAPQEDVDRLFRQMVFNGAFGNTDDHLKNFWVVHNGRGFRLSEAFDLVPNVGEQHEHCLAFQYAHSAPSHAELLAIARDWQVADAATVIARVADVMVHFPAVAKTHGVLPENIREIGVDILRRLKLLSA
jgi:serine/threonine-protein kinase HipA